MNRIPKFRAWYEAGCFELGLPYSTDKDTKMFRMCEVQTIHLKTKSARISIPRVSMNNELSRYGKTHYSSNVSLDKIKLMQYMELLDKNGKEVWEGDIVVIPNEQFTPENGKDPNLICPIVFERGVCCAKWPSGFIPCWDWMEEVEVIGNVHEDPELLK